MTPEITFNENEILKERNAKVVNNNIATAAHSSLLQSSGTLSP